MADWITWFIALFQTTIQWLSSMEIMGVSILWLLVCSFILIVMLRAFLFKP